MTSGPADHSEAIPAQVTAKLQEILLRGSRRGHLCNASAHSARGWFDIMGEAAQAEESDRARNAFNHGLAAPGAADPALRIAFYWRAAAIAIMLDQDETAAQTALASRAEILRAHGQHRQADLEQQLGTLLITSGGDSFSTTVLEGVIEQEREYLAGPEGVARPDTALPELLVALAFRRFDEQHAEEAADLLAEAAKVMGQRAGLEGFVTTVGLESGLKLFLAQVHLAMEDTETADAYATEVINAGTHRATRAELWLIRALAAQAEDRLADAALFACRALELFTALGMRARAASAAAIIAAQAQKLSDHQTAVLALRIAADHAEQGEVEDSAHLVFALGHELMVAGQFKEAEDILTGLSRRAQMSGNPVAHAQVLVDLGHAIRQQPVRGSKDQRRIAETIELWQQAKQLMLDGGAQREAANIALATGALLSTQGRMTEAEAAMQQAVDLGRAARPEPSLALAQALNGLGHLRCEQQNPVGIDNLQEAIKIAEDAGADWRNADYTDTLARGFWALKQPGPAVATALTAADKYRAAGDPTTAHQSDLFASYVLLETKQGMEAAAVLNSVLDGKDDSGTEESGALDKTIKLAAYTGLVDAHKLLGEYGKAQYYQARADEIAENFSSEDQTPDR